jgi:hypothetical protein
MTDEQLHELMEAHRHYSAAAEVFKSAHEEIKRLRDERNQLRAEIVDRALGIRQDVIWDINSPTRERCEKYARSRGWHDLWDKVNEQERLLREGRTSDGH